MHVHKNTHTYDDYVNIKTYCWIMLLQVLLGISIYMHAMHALECWCLQHALGEREKKNTEQRVHIFLRDIRIHVWRLLGVDVDGEYSTHGVKGPNQSHHGCLHVTACTRGRFGTLH